MGIVFSTSLEKSRYSFVRWASQPTLIPPLANFGFAGLKGGQGLKNQGDTNHGGTEILLRHAHTHHH